MNGTPTRLADRIATGTRPHRAVWASRLRAQRSYSSSFRFDLFGSGVVGIVQLIEVLLVFTIADGLGGLRVSQAVLVTGLSAFAFSTAQLIGGHLDELSGYLKAGTLDVFYLRPQPILAQLITSEFSLRRTGWAAVGLATAVWGLTTNAIDWSPAAVALLVLIVPAGIVICLAQSVIAAGVQFFLIDGADATNGLVHGGRYAASQPASIWSAPLKAVFGFVAPVVFVGYLPALWLLDLPGPAWFPTWLAWCAPVAALASATLAALVWRIGIRHYQGAGG